MKVGDHILQIGDVNLRGMGSEQVAQVLRNQGLNSVNLVLARPIHELPSGPLHPSLAPILPTRIISDVNETQRQLAIAKAAFAAANEVRLSVFVCFFLLVSVFSFCFFLSQREEMYFFFPISPSVMFRIELFEDSKVVASSMSLGSVSRYHL